ncbi:spindle pole body-associated protein sad1 [Cordyceps fumosorosea ARSEF 2679]|uniref:Spindle pole body-associated protein sad1 n=1 Tax=Cordyceps fumosorosea (strain ARSEF 2679) TaxID=1081104 RepID=A0A167R7T2_CORFA|nr:spindle pole body-associated protein sad1 [Cordyceps fumosorosea ARSEF 2679]OAA58352.1 spindle pole body-associated protein sad1 [Cordyceps fumosorosea ARSEF 2679]
MPLPGTPYRPRLDRERARATRAPEGDTNEFRMPTLPPLPNTPSAHRQYTYGAGAEPAPARPAHRGAVVDLSRAVRGALSRHEERRAADERRQSNQDLFLLEADRSDHDKDQASRQAADQLAMPPPSFTPLQKSASKTAVSTAPAEQEDDGSDIHDGSDTDDARSFLEEGDFYGEAAIALTSGNAPAIGSRQRHITRSQIRNAEHQTAGSQEPPSDTPRGPPPSSIAEDEGLSPPNVQDTPGLRSNPRRGKLPNPWTAGVESQQPGRAASSTSIFRPPQKSPTPNSNGTQVFPAARERATEESGFAAGKRFSQRPETSQRTPVRPRSGNSDRGTVEPEEETAVRPSLFTQAKEYAVAASPFSTRSHNAPNHSAMDDAMQREIESSESDSVDSEQRGWTWMRPITSLPYICRYALRDQDDLLIDAIDWWQLLNPYTYFEALCWGLSSVYSSVLEWLQRLFTQTVIDGLFSSLEMVLYFVAAVIALITLLDNDGFARLDEYLRQYQREFERVQQAGKLHESSLKKLEAVVPKLVHIQLEDGKPVVAQEFWHALRDLIHRDGDFLTLEQKGSRYEIASGAHWQAIAERMAGDPVLTGQINATVQNMELRVKQGVIGFWEDWIQNNQAKIITMLGAAINQINSAGTQKEFEKQLQRIVKQHIDESNKSSTVISREEFLSHIKSEFATHRAEVHAEFAELQPQLENLVREAVELAGKGVPESMRRAEMVTLVHGMVSKAVADLNLDAMARGQIHSHWDSVLRHQINYFGVGSGATIDVQHSSATFEPPANSLYVKQKGLRGVQTPIVRAALEPWSDEGDCWCAARSQNRRGNPHGAILAVHLGYRIVPRHVVVEHIVAAATTDPDARPKEIEVYADVDPDLRELVRDFSATHFPDIYPLDDWGQQQQEGWNVSPAELPKRFVKIGQFVYEDVQLHDGVQVHRLSDELLNLGVATDHVIVRAVSNYGAKAHTCFYRVRLYGERF